MRHSFHYRRISTRVLLLSLAVMASGLHAQEHRPALGVSYEFGVPNSIDRSPNLVNLFGSTGGYAYDHTVRAGLELVDDLLGIGHDQTFLLNLSGSIGGYHSDRFTTLDGQVYDYLLNVNALDLGVDMRLRYPLGNGWSIDPGVWLSYRVLASYTETLRNLDQKAMPFWVNGAADVVARGDTLGSFPLRYGLLLSTRLPLIVRPSLQFSPEINSRVDLGAIRLGLRAFGIGAGIVLRFGSGPADSLPKHNDGSPLPATTEREHVEHRSNSVSDRTDRSDRARPVDSLSSARPSRFKLSASVDLRAIDADGNIRQWGDVTMDLERRRITLMLPASIQLDPALMEAPNISSNDRARFSDSSDAGTYRASLGLALDTLGARMRREPSALIGLRGNGARAAAERSMLARYWKVDAERIILSERTAESDHDSLMDLAPMHGHESLFAPIEKNWFVRDVHIPRLDIVPEITASAGVRHWEVSVRHGERIVARSSSDSASAASLLAIELPAELSDSTIPPFVAELVAEDSVGSSVAAYDTLPLRLARKSSGSAVWERSVWKVLLLQDFSSCSSCLDSAEAMLKLMAGAITERDRIVIGAIWGKGMGPSREMVHEIADHLSMLLRQHEIRPRSLAVQAEKEADGEVSGDVGAGAITITVSSQGAEGSSR